MSRPQQVKIVSGAAARRGVGFKSVAFFDADGNPVDPSGSGGGGDVTVDAAKVQFPTGLPIAINDKNLVVAMTDMNTRVVALESAVADLTARLEALEGA